MIDDRQGIKGRHATVRVDIPWIENILQPRNGKFPEDTLRDQFCNRIVTGIGAFDDDGVELLELGALAGLSGPSAAASTCEAAATNSPSGPPPLVEGTTA